MNRKKLKRPWRLVSFWRGKVLSPRPTVEKVTNAQ